jgi:hypothetical protein
MLPHPVYTGKNTELDSPVITADTNKPTAIVLKSVEPLLKQGRTMWMDNFYNSPSLARTPKITHKTDCWNSQFEPQECATKSEKHTTKKR